MTVRTFSWVMAAFLFFAPHGLAQTKPAEEPMTLTLSQAIDLALEQNIDLKLAQLDLATFRSQYKQAIGAAIGDLKATASYTRNIRKQAFFLSTTDPATGSISQQKITLGGDNTFAAGLAFDQPLFSGGRVATAISAGKKRIGAGEEAVRGAREDVVLATKEFFFGYLLADSTQAIATDNLKLAQEHLSTIQARFHQGLDSDLTVLRQQVEVASAETNLIQARNLEDLSVTNLQKVLDLDVDRPLQPVGKLDPPSGELPSYDAVIHTALAKNATLSVARSATIVAQDYYKIVRADRLPDLKGFAEYNWMAQSDSFSPGPSERNDSFGAGLRFEWKFFTGGETQQRIVQAKIDWNRSRDMETKVEREIRVAVKQAWLGVQEARERARSQETAVGQAKRALEATEVRYKQGHASQLEQNDATLALNRSRTIFAQASHDYWIARATLEKTVGTSLEEIR